MSKSSVTFLVLFVVCSLSVAQTSGDAAAGRILAEKSCIYCHGPDGNGNLGRSEDARNFTPRISGQPQAYFIKSLGAYKQGTRSNDDMNIVAEQLSDEEIRNLAAWYAAQPPSATATYKESIF